ncbi:MAG: NPCBM/NEW2 domain-containing protein [Planctomycetes bacterium]|nr:NPCBM/NEW2 domain-containing protein [Planctomycetota bacterium]
MIKSINKTGSCASMKIYFFMLSFFICTFADMFALSLIKMTDSDAPFCTLEDVKTLNNLYGTRLKRINSSKDKISFSKELLEASDEFDDGIKYLMLTYSAGLAEKSRDYQLGVACYQKLLLAQKENQHAIRSKLLYCQEKGIKAEEKILKRKKEKYIDNRPFYVLCVDTIENAIELTKLSFQIQDYKTSKSATKIAIAAAELISSSKVTLLRRYAKFSTTLESRYRVAKLQKKSDLTNAIWAYLDVGAYGEAEALLGEQAEKVQKISVDVGLNKDVEISDIYEAGRAWDERSQNQKSTLKEICMIRAAELYEKSLRNDFKHHKIAKMRLLQLNKNLEDMLGALRKSNEWVYLADLPIQKSRVGFGKLKVHKPGGESINVAGHKFSTGFAAHANSNITFHLNGKYRNFSSSYGLGTGAGGKAYFKIRCDGKEVHKSSYFWGNTTKTIKKPVTISLVGANVLELISEADNISGSFSCWGDPKIK